MCFAPQRRALFQHLNFQKWSGAGVFCTFWLGNVLRVTMACNFSSLIWPDGSAPAALASLLFDPPSHKSLEGDSVSRLSYLFAHLDLLSCETFSFLVFFLLLFSSLLFSPLLSSSLLFSSLRFSSLTLPISAFHLSILSEVWLLNFLRLAHRRPFAGGQSQQTVVKHRFLALGHAGKTIVHWRQSSKDNTQMVEVRSDVFTSDDRACVPTTKAHYRTQHSTCSKSVASLSILRSHAVQLSPLMSFSCLSSSSLLPVFFPCVDRGQGVFGVVRRGVACS